MIGSIIGDLVGSTREFKPIKKLDFTWLPSGSSITDDTILTIATADALLNQIDFGSSYLKWGRLYPSPKGSYGNRFKEWLLSKEQIPYESYGNGSAMRVSPIGWLTEPIDFVLQNAEHSAICTHNHPEGIKAAKAIAELIWLLKSGKDKIKSTLEIAEKYQYKIDQPLNEIRPDYQFDETSQGTLPIVLRCFLESTSMESAVRLAVSMGGDADTMASISGALAESYYEPDMKIVCEALSYLPLEMKSILFDLYENPRFGFMKKYDAQKIELIKNYFAGTYKIHWNGWDEEVLFDAKTRKNKTTLGIVTAYNPFSEQREDSENQKNSIQLKKQIEHMKCSFVETTSSDKSGLWIEKGFAIVGLTKDQLKEIGQRFNQNAVVFLEKGKPSELVWCY